jgi:hypothetical protein
MPTFLDFRIDHSFESAIFSDFSENSAPFLPGGGLDQIAEHFACRRMQIYMKALEGMTLARRVLAGACVKFDQGRARILSASRLA